jgi:ribonuclease P protein component
VVVYVALEGGPSWAAFAVSRRVGGAVVRNRARRLLREAWRGVEPQVREGCQVVLVARPEIVGAKAQEVAREVRTMLDRSGVLQG